jgi:hypothetical protein
LLLSLNCQNNTSNLSLAPSSSLSLVVLSQSLVIRIGFSVSHE